MRRFITALLLGAISLALSSCGQTEDGNFLNRRSVDGRMRILMKDFVRDAHIYGGLHVSTDGVDFGRVLTETEWESFQERKKLDKEIVGLCETVDNYMRDQIGPIVKKTLSQSVRVTIQGRPDFPAWERVLGYHELGHCVLGLDHREDRVSIMNPNLPDDDYISKHEESLIKDLFRLDEPAAE